MKLLLPFILTVFTTACFAQDVEVIDFERLETRIKNQPADKAVIYNFWATWCKPCVEEMPYFEMIHKEYGPKGVEVVFVSLDFKSKLSKVETFVVNKGLKAEVVLLDAPDYNAWIDKVSPEWSGAIPATLVVKGDKQLFHEGSFTYQTLEKFIKPIL